MGTRSLAVVISGATLLLVVIVVAPFALCCFFRRRKRDEESNPLLESNLPAISSKPVKRDSYGGASRLSPTESYPPLTSVPADAPTTSSKYAQSVRRKYELGGKTEQNSQQVIPPQASAPAEAPNTDIVAIHEKSTQSVRSKNRLGRKMDKNAQALGERKDKLKTIERTCGELDDKAAGFLSLADDLVAKKKKKKKSSRK